MASVTLAGIWIHDGTNLSSYYNHLNGGDILGAVACEGETQTYAGGRIRSIRTDAEPKSAQVGLRLVLQADRETLDGWVGDRVLFRDPRGRMFYGTYYTVHAQEVPGAVGYCNISLTVNEVTYDIEV